MTDKTMNPETLIDNKSKQVILGVIAGDMIGSVCEAPHIKMKRKAGWELFRGDVFNKKGLPSRAKGTSRLTDDTTMTLAICEAVFKSRTEGADLPEEAVRSMRTIGQRYPWGFGYKFKRWVTGKIEGAYNSFGNGSAMRVSACAFAAGSVEEVKQLSHAVTAVTHDHPEGLKGAEAVAVCLYLALHGMSPAEVQAYCHEHYYPMDFMVDDIRADYTFSAWCQASVPQALKAAFEGPDYESVIRSCVALGGDADTLAAMAGGIAAAFYGLPSDIAAHAWERMPYDDLRDIFLRFTEKFPG